MKNNLISICAVSITAAFFLHVVMNLQQITLKTM